MSTLERRCVMVTGASGNLGAAVVERLRRAGATVVALTRKQADLSVEAQVEAAFESALQQHGAIWGSVHCAGGWIGAPFAQTPLELFEKMIDINLRSCFLCCRAALRRMRGEGRIVNVAALNAATLSGVRGSAAYAASKAGVVALTKAIAEEGGGVRANCIAPGAMRTSANGNLPGQVPLEEVAEAILYLVSPEAGALNGAVLTFPSR
ncbi:MAG: SDR family oxidoreductase [Deltaproteobacteria bacterium]|nr:MAG: SDR family oxidoreductase [Deltaproteobacteria bacterium]